jgi:hypothetical protein
MACFVNAEGVNKADLYFPIDPSPAVRPQQQGHVNVIE